MIPSALPKKGPSCTPKRLKGGSKLLEKEGGDRSEEEADNDKLLL